MSKETTFLNGLSEIDSSINHAIQSPAQIGSPLSTAPPRFKHSLTMGSNNHDEQLMMLKPLPLLDQSVPMQQEPQLLKAFKRTLLQARQRRLNEADNQCPHTKVDNWLCSDCNSRVSSFGCIFDSYKGKVRTFMKVVYENDFLEDFQNAQGGGIGDDESEGALTNNEQNKDQEEDNIQSISPELLYSQYQPANVTELREYILFTICKKLKKQFKKSQTTLLGPGHVNHLSHKLITYLQENDSSRKKLLQKHNNDILLFDSIFECGNLLQAEMMNPNEYQMYMQVDTNTRGHQQWFFFRVRNTKKNRKYTFRIMNFTKMGTTPNQNNPQSNNNPGKQDHLQKIHFISKLSQDTEWRVIGSESIEFVKTSVARKRKDILAAAADSDQEENDAEMEQLIESQKAFNKQKSPKKRKAQYYYALQLEVQFEHSNDSVYFAYSLPYTLTEMTESILKKEQSIQTSAAREEEEVKQFLDEAGGGEIQSMTPREKPQQVMQGTQGGTPVWQENGVTIEVESKGLFYKRDIMCRSICGLPLYLITIGKDSKSYKKKPVIIITSRVHAAETPGSFVFDGIYNFLTSNTQEARLLRKFYTFTLVPTLNPDGVACGNYRSSVSGVDLNRQWISPDEEYHPEIFAIKQLLKVYYEKERRQLWIYCDLHGHSKKKNSFFYGCNTAANGGFLSWTIVRLLPRIFAQKTHLFNYKDCRFKVEPYKLGTGRVVAWKQFMITHSFTLESSFYGYDFGDDESKLFTEKEYHDVGSKLCSSIFELHFLWKSIRNELKTTNGWLKPRKLMEITGIPAAQLLSEELQKKKKEDLKKKAIEQYEQFLKKFYNKGDAPINLGTIQNNAPRRGSKLIVNQKPISSDQVGTISSKTSPTKQQNKNNQQEAIIVKSRNSKELTANNTEQQSTQQNGDDLYYLLLGLVKIQALIRGYLTRKKTSLMMPKQAYKPTFDQIRVSLNVNRFAGEMLSQADIQKIQQKSVRDNFGIKNPESKLPVDEVLEGFNWRQYFQEQELEEAYHHVEVEKEDDPQDNFSDGSSSNPSQDNFDIQDIYEQIYQMQNAQEFAFQKEQANNRFLLEMNDQEYIDQQAMFHILDEGFKGKRVIGPRQSIRRKSFNKGKTFKEPGSASKPNPQQSLDRPLNRKPSFYESSKTEDMHPLTAHQIVDPNKHDKNQNSYSRIQTGHPSSKGGQIPNQKQLFNQSLANGFGISSAINSGKKESMQQVIKDCFITKKIGNVQQPAYFGLPDGQRVHSMNNYKLYVQNQVQPPYNSKKQGQLTNRKNTAAAQSFNYKTPVVMHSKDQQKLYFNPQGAQIPVTYFPGSSNEKYRAFIAAQAAASGKYFNQEEDSSYAQQQVVVPHGGMTYYGSQSFNLSGGVQQNNSGMMMMVGGNGGAQDPKSSLFMKYVKSKMTVKKVKTSEMIPQQVADKYIDIYKELIDKEAQKKLEEQEFLKRHQGINFVHQTNNPSAASQVSRNKNNQTRSEQKSRHNKHRAVQPQTNHQNLTTRKDHQIEPFPRSNGLEDNFQKEAMIRSSFDAEAVSFIKYKIIGDPQQSSSGTGKPQINHQDLGIINPDVPNFQEFVNPKLLAYQSVPISTTTNDITKLPLINNFQQSTSSMLKDKKQSKKQAPSHSLKNVVVPQSDQKQQQPYHQYSYNLPAQQSHMIKQQSEKSVDSSIDDEMLDKIKNIYSEMLKQTNNSQYYSSSSTATNKQQPRQKRLIVQQQPLIPGTQFNTFSALDNKNGQVAPKIKSSYQVNKAAAYSERGQ